MFTSVARGRACPGGGMRGRRDGLCSGRYASYWNAFLLNIETNYHIFKYYFRFCSCCSAQVLKQKKKKTPLILLMVFILPVVT